MAAVTHPWTRSAQAAGGARSVVVHRGPEDLAALLRGHVEGPQGLDEPAQTTEPQTTEPETEQPVDDQTPDGQRIDGVEDAGAVAQQGAEAGSGDESARTRSGPRHAARVPLLSVPESLRSVNTSVAVRAVRGFLVVALVIVAVLGARAWWVHKAAGPVAAGEVVGPVQVVGADGEAAVGSGREGSGTPGSGPDGALTEGSGTEGPGADGSGADGSGTAAPAAVAGSSSGSDGSAPGASLPGELEASHPDAQPAPSTLLVHVSGAVVSPGVVQVPDQARVIDAVRAAGGFTPEADQGSLNLARLLVDGEQVWVGAPGQEAPPGVGPPPQAGGTASGNGQVAGPGAGGAPGRGQPVDLNTATTADLEELPGIGPVTAAQILSWRETHGRFSAVEELMEVSGIGEKTFTRLEPLVTVGH